MASNILGIYNAVEALSVTVGSDTPTINDLDELPNTVDSAKLPTRLLFPFGDFEGLGASDATYPVMTGRIKRVTWQIRDLCLWQTVGAGVGWSGIAPTLVQYAGLYIDQLVSNQQLTSQAWINRSSVIPGVVEWPQSSGRMFFAVDARLEIVELVS